MYLSQVKKGPHPCYISKCRSLDLVTGLLLILLSQPTAFADTSRDMLADKINKAITNVSNKGKIIVDPKVTNEIISDAEIFSENFCMKDPAPCDRVFSDEVLLSILSDFFQDLKGLPENIETVASRLARHEGINMADSGWPDSRVNQISVITLPDNLANSDISLITATSTIHLGQTGKLFFVEPGKQQLTVKLGDGRVINGVVTAAARSNGVWAVTSQRKTLLGDNIDPDLSLYCKVDPAQERHVPPKDEPLGLFNIGRSTIVENDLIRLSNVIPAARQPGLDIKITDQTKSCTQECLNDIAAAFIQGISVWRSGCSRCTGNSLVVLRFENSVWIDSRAARRLRDTSDKLPSVDYDLSHIQPNEIQSYMHAPGYWQSGSFIIGYERLDTNDSLKQTLCQISDKQFPGWIPLAQYYTCNKATHPPMQLSPELEITKGWTDCGEEAIACAIPGGKIQITDKYSYWINDDSTSFIFNGEMKNVKFNINTILLHEVGHWFGLRHPETLQLTYKDVMQGIIDTDFECVAPQSLVMLNNATDIRWPSRAKENQGLMPPQKLSGDKSP